MIATAKRAKVLVIDDELGPRESLRVLLKNEYEVRCVNSVDLGVQMLRELEPDVIVMDIRMPGKTGIEGLREIRSLDPHVAVIMLTGFGALETAQEALRLGANDYLKKPFDIVEMQDVIRANVHRSQINRRRASTEHELQALNGQLTSQLEKKDLMATLGQASAELVHDLRNPLAAVLGYVQILSEDLAKARETQHGTPEATTEYIGLIEQNIQRCREMVEAWQDISRPQRRKPEPMRPSSVLEKILDAQRTLAASRNAALQIRVEDPDAQIMGDAVQLGRALQNIVVNAFDALPSENGYVSVSGSRVRDRYTIEVQDNGSGIAPEALPHLFKPDFSTKAATKKGTGLGLFITKRIIEDHAGLIHVESVEGKGTKMTISLPLCAESPA